MSAQLPNFLIVGAAKSGTTSLATWLADHPEVFVAAEKELHFFNLESNWARGVAWYAEQFAASTGETAIGEATPIYLFADRAVERMAQVVPGARLIVCLREPASRALSHWRHWYFRRTVERRPFAEAVEEEMAQLASRPRDELSAYSPDGGYYVEMGRYLPQLERLCRHFPRDRVHVLLLEDLQGAPRETFADVCRFLGIDDRVVPDSVGTTENVAFEFRPLPLWRLLVRHSDRLPNPVAKFLALRVLRRRPRRQPPMDPALRRRLQAFYAEDNARLAAWLGRDLAAWNEEARAGAA